MTKEPSLDALLPPEVARKAESIGVTKAVDLDLASVFLLAILAGAFIAIGGAFSTTVGSGPAEALGLGASRLLSGLVFSTGLILVVVAGAELFTGNNLIIMSWASRRVTTRQLLRNWAVVFVGNFVGAVVTAGLVFLSGQHELGGGLVGGTALRIAHAKIELTWIEAFSRGVLCNALVCLAVWLSLSGRSTGDKILAVCLPIAAFVTIGFEHCVANMYFFPLGWLIERGTEIDGMGGPGLTWWAFVSRNLVPVTLGNVVGGAGLVGAIYWMIYLRRA